MKEKYLLLEKVLQFSMKWDVRQKRFVEQQCHECLTRQSSSPVYLLIALLYQATHSTGDTAVT